MYLKHWKTLETTLKTESNYLLANVALPILPSTFFAYQCHVDLVFRILTKLFKNFNKLAAIFSFNVFLIREWLKI